MPPEPFPAVFREELIALIGCDSLREAERLSAIDPGVSQANLGATLMARPKTAAKVAATLALCARYAVPVVPQGGRTGLSGGAYSSPGELILSTQAMTAIEDIDPVSRTATVQAGVTLETLDNALSTYGLSPGIDLGARGSATIGGMVATNAGGIDAFRLGTMRERVLGLEVALSNGRVMTELSRVRKDNAGLPLRQLLIGSEGTLGIITRVVLNVVARPADKQAAFAITPDLRCAIHLMRDLEKDARIHLQAAELMSGNHIALTARALSISAWANTPPEAYGLLLTVNGADPNEAQSALESALARADERGELLDGALPKNLTQERDLWRIREDWAVDRARPGGLWYDVSVPVSALADYLAALQTRIQELDPQLSVFVVGHLADGNVHVTVNAEQPLTPRYEEIAAMVYAGLRELGGSFSAEHGVGLEKRASLEKWAGPENLALMQAIKSAFDPAGIMNPGKVLRLAGTAT